MKQSCAYPHGPVLRRSAFVALAAAALVPRPARAQATPLRVIGFTSGTQLPLVVAQSKGYFAAQNLAVTLTATPGSVYQFQHLSAGDFELATTALDNIIAYDEGQTNVVLPNPPDFVGIMGGDTSCPDLWVQNEIAGYPDLRGKTFAVDAANSGFSFILRRMLEVHGLKPGDYRFDPVGSTPRRLARLKEGPAVSGGMLDPSYGAEARAAGLHLLQRGNEVVGPYGGTVIAARRSWLEAHPDPATRFLRALLSALDWMFVPANRTEAARLLAEHTKTTPQDAAPVLAGLLDPPYGFSRDGAMSPAAERVVLDLRTAYGEPKKTLTDADKYYDGRYLAQARRR